MGRACILAAISLLVLTLAPSQVKATTYQTCMRNYMNAAMGLTDTNQICPLASKLFKCILNSEAYKNVELTETNISSMESMLENLLSRYGIHCDFNIRAMVDHVSKGKPTVEQRCLTEYFKGASSVTSMSDICPIARKMVQCIIDGHPRSDLGKLNAAQLDDMLRARLQSYGVSCDVDVQGMINARYQGRQGSVYDRDLRAHPEYEVSRDSQGENSMKGDYYRYERRESDGNAAGALSKVSALFVAAFAMVLRQLCG